MSGLPRFPWVVYWAEWTEEESLVFVPAGVCQWNKGNGDYMDRGVDWFL